MKPNEIAIGDWVTCPTPFRVTGIYDDDPWVVYDEDGLSCELASVEPIPLTPEILEANGFKVEEECDSYEWGLGNRYILTKDEGQIEVYWRDNCDEEDLIWYANICGFNACADMTRRNKSLYVHELQQALRLCGLNNVADNFKVK